MRGGRTSGRQRSHLSSSLPYLAGVFLLADAGSSGWSQAPDHARRLGRAPPIRARRGRPHHPPCPPLSPRPRGLGAVRAPKGPAYLAELTGSGCREGLGLPTRDRAFRRERGARRPPEDGARGGARSHGLLWRGAQGAPPGDPRPPSRPPQASGNCPVTTEAPRTRHEPLPGPPGKRQGTTFRPSQGGRTCAEALLKSRGSVYARSLWVGGKSAGAVARQLVERGRCFHVCTVILIVVETSKDGRGAEEMAQRPRVVVSWRRPRFIPNTYWTAHRSKRTNGSSWRTDALFWCLWALHAVVLNRLQASYSYTHNKNEFTSSSLALSSERLPTWDIPSGMIRGMVATP